MKNRSNQQWETEPIQTDLGTAKAVLTYEFDPGEPRVDYYPDGSGNPGTAPSVSIYKIELEIIDIDVDIVKEIEDEIRDEIIRDEVDPYNEI